MFLYLIEILYLIAATIAIGACIPQLKQLIKAKASDEFSLSTWMVWAMAQSVTLMYVISLGNTLMAVVNVVWVSFYTAMSVLIIRYRYKKRTTDVLSTDNAAVEE